MTDKEDLERKLMVDYLQTRAKYFNEDVGNLDKVDGYDCPKCKNKGAIAVLGEHDNKFALDIVMCDCTKIRKTIQLMKQSGLEEMLKKYKLEEFETDEPWQKTIKAKAMGFLQVPVGMFFIGGQSGCGKTFICTAIARKLLYEGRELRYEIWREMSTQLKKNIGDKEYTDLIDQIKKVDILYIDDFLKVPVGDEIGRPSQADLSLALEIINYRYNNKLVTLISSEWTSNEIIGFDEALGSRICEMAGKSNLNIRRDRNKNMRMRAMEL